MHIIMHIYCNHINRRQGKRNRVFNKSQWNSDEKLNIKRTLRAWYNTRMIHIQMPPKNIGLPESCWFLSIQIFVFQCEFPDCVWFTASFSERINSSAVTKKFIYVLYKYILKRVYFRCSESDYSLTTTKPQHVWMEQNTTSDLLLGHRVKERANFLSYHPGLEIAWIDKQPRMLSNSIIIFPILEAGIDIKVSFKTSDNAPYEEEHHHNKGHVSLTPKNSREKEKLSDSM